MNVIPKLYKAKQILAKWYILSYLMSNSTNANDCAMLRFLLKATSAIYSKEWCEF